MAGRRETPEKGQPTGHALLEADRSKGPKEGHCSSKQGSLSRGPHVSFLGQDGSRGCGRR